MLESASTDSMGWKTIANHLGRDARTAQRWHRDRGMPVHHIPGAKGASVFAYPEELKSWLNGHPDWTDTTLAYRRLLSNR